MIQPKPQTDEEKIAWCLLYDAASHDDKIKLCGVYDIAYDTARHWRSDWSHIPKKFLESKKSEEEAEPTLDLPEELFNGAGTNLDFACLDLETSNLNADFSVLLCACIKPYGKETMVFRADEYNPNWAVERMDDEALTRAIAEETKKHAIIVTHYGSKFDIPYLRAKMANYKMTPLPPAFGVDTYPIAKANFKVSSRRLENLARYFGMGKKSKVEGGLWMKAAMDGDIEALNAIVEHCVQDVVLLEKLASLSFPYLRSIRRL